jgi:hypothetical protein
MFALSRERVLILLKTIIETGSKQYLVGQIAKNPVQKTFLRGGFGQYSELLMSRQK